MMKKESKLIKILRYLCLSFVFVIGLVAIVGTGGCGGGSSSGGGGGSGDGSTSLATGEFTKTVTLASNIGWTSPFQMNDRHLQQLYLASDIEGAGYIQSIELRLNTATTGCSCPDATIKMGHTSLGVLTNTFANNVEQGKGTLETVRTGAFSVPAGSAGDYFTIILDTPFLYNGVDNLVVEFLVTGCDADIILWADNTLPVFRMLHRWDLTATPTTTGDLYLYVIHTRFNFEGGVNALEYAPLPSNGNSIPFGLNREKIQLLYDATIINGSGPVTGIALRTGLAVTTDQNYTYTMRVGHSTLTDLTIDFNGNFSDTPVIVADNVGFNVPAGIPVGDYIWIPMPDGSFNYNGNDNLIVEIEVSSSSGITWWGREATGTDMTRAFGDLGSDTAAGVDNHKNHISFRFNGGTMDVITAEEANWSVPFISVDDYKSQSMFGAQQLGTGGPVTGISLRLAGDSSPSDYPAATVVLGHTTNTVMSTTFANNMTDPTTVFTGTLNVPAGLKAGDWVTIPVSGFTYDSTKNLVVEVSQNAGTATNRILGTHVDVPGPSGGISGLRGVPIATEPPSAGQSDIRIHLSK
jgi:hypothetical protein